MYYQNKNIRNSFFWSCLAMIFIACAGLYYFFPYHVARLYSSLNKNLKSEEVKADEKIKIDRKVFGYSVQGRAIEGYEIGSGENNLLMIAAMHGSEMASSDLLNRFVLELALDPSIVSKTKKLIIVPIVNPDGYFERGDKLNGNGVNLDLNFNTSDWQKYGPEGTYAGSEPFSEAESQVIEKIVEQYRPLAMISFHSYGNLVSPEAGESSIKLANWYIGKTGYEYYDIWDYPGTATKWFAQTTGNAAVTIELSKDPANNWKINKEALFELVSTDNDLLPD